MFVEAPVADGPKTARIEVRLSADTKALIEQGALLRGQKLTDFVTSTLSREARKIMVEQQKITLSNRDRDRFLALLDADVEPTESMKRAARNYAADVVSK